MSSVATAVPLAVDSEAMPAIYPIAQQSVRRRRDDLHRQCAGGVSERRRTVLADGQRPLHRAQGGAAVEPRLHSEGRRGHQGLRHFRVTTSSPPTASRLYGQRGERRASARNQATLTGVVPNQTLRFGLPDLRAQRDGQHGVHSARGPHLQHRHETVRRDRTTGVPVTYTVGATSVTDSRHPANSFPGERGRRAGDFHRHHLSAVTFTFDDSANNPVTAEFAYINQFFIDVIAGVTYYIDEAR